MGLLRLRISQILGGFLFALALPLSSWAGLPPAFEGVGESFLRFTPAGADIVRRLTGEATATYSAATYDRALARLEMDEFSLVRDRLAQELEAARQELAKYQEHRKKPRRIKPGSPLAYDEESKIEIEAATRFSSPDLRDLMARALARATANPATGIGRMTHGNYHATSHAFIEAAALENAGRLQESAWAYRKAGQLDAAARVEGKLLAVFGKGPVRKVEALKGSGSEVYLMTFESGPRGIFKPKMWASNPGAEVAAFKMDRLLGADRVPLTILSSWKGRDGSLQYYVADGQAPLDTDPIDPEIWLFDQLINNVDRSDVNRLYTHQDHPVAIDHGASFGDDPTVADYKLDHTKPRLRWLETLRHLPESVTRSELQGLIDEKSITALLSRRRGILEYFYSPR